MTGKFRQRHSKPTNNNKNQTRKRKTNENQ
jgi:hypothetical protein